MARRDFDGSYSSGDETYRFGRDPAAPEAVPTLPPSGSVSDTRFAPGTILAGRYRLVAMLGRGGMGEVYRAEDLKLGEPVALKFLPEELNFDAKALGRFHQEVRVARQITHRNVCRVYDIGEAQGTHFLTMEYIDGEDLSTLLRRIGRLPQGKALELARQICRGLAAAHDAGVLHRDLKPANVMVDGRGQAKISDFGLARLLEELRQSATSQFVGTPAYMAPEQIRGETPNERSDLFSLGLVLYEMFTGKRAFPDEDWLHLLGRGGRTVAPTEPWQHVESLSPDIGSALLRCIEEDPRDRPGSVLEVLATLPGGDPLRAALEAGETPSPEMVAGVSEDCALTPWQAASLYAVFAVALVSFHWTADRTTLLGMVGPKIHPEALEDRARTLLHDVGWTVESSASSDSYSAFRYEETLIENCDAVSRADWHRRIGQRPSLITFYFRSSDSSLFDPRVERPTPDIPEASRGDAMVRLDPTGRLEHLRLDPRPGPASGATDWASVFTWAGLEIAEFRPLAAPPLNTADRDLPVHDVRRAWTGRVDGSDLRVDAASLGSLPVYFELSLNRDKPILDQSLISSQIFVAFYAFLALAALAAFLNLRRRRGDVRGAVTTATVVAVATLLSEFASRHVGPTVGEVGFLGEVTSTVAYRTFIVAVLYLAMEPAVRAWTPDVIVSWTRLVRGRWRDSRVGRDVLLGFATGTASITVFVHYRWFVLASPWTIFDLDRKLAGGGPTLGLVGWLLFNSVTASLAAAFALALLSRWFKHRWLAALVLTVAVVLLAQSPLVAVLSAILAVVGVVAFVAAWAAISVVGFTPATADPSLWWAWPEAWLMSGSLLVVGVVAYRHATGLGTVSAARTR